MEANWKWEEEKPKWLHENMRAKIPVEWIPEAEDSKLEIGRRACGVGLEIGPGVRRKLSLLKSMIRGQAAIAPSEDQSGA